MRVANYLKDWMIPGRLDLEKIDDDGNIDRMQAGKKDYRGKFRIKEVCALKGWAYRKKSDNPRKKMRDRENARIWFHAK